jgi:hypothetical protein
MSTSTTMMPVVVDERDDVGIIGIGIDGSERMIEEKEFEIRRFRPTTTTGHSILAELIRNTLVVVSLSTSLLFMKSQLQLLQLQQKQHETESALPSSSSSATYNTTTKTMNTERTTVSSSLRLRMIPKDILSNEILSFLSEKTVKRFLSCLGERRVKNIYKLDQRFCLKHGSKLEDLNKFQNMNTHTHNTNITNTTKRTPVNGEDEDLSSSSTTPKPKKQLPEPSSMCLSCPECYAEEQHTKRCHSCKKFYPKFFFISSNSNSKNKTSDDHTTPASINSRTEGPGLWCQQCDRMAFCNACLSNDIDGCGSTRINAEDVDDNDDDDDDYSNNYIATNKNSRINPVLINNRTTSIAPFGAFGGRQKRLLRRNYCNNHESSSGGRSMNTTGRITCHNCCCPNVFTNTMCGEFICDDCGEQHIKKSSTRTDGDGDDNDEYTNTTTPGVEVCDECGKATCLDPNCLVCTDFRLINICCSFVAEDAYKFDFFGGNNTADSLTKLRHGIGDIIIYIGFLFILYNMWWYHLNQDQQQDLVTGEL